RQPQHAAAGDVRDYDDECVLLLGRQCAAGIGPVEIGRCPHPAAGELIAEPLVQVITLVRAVVQQYVDRLSDGEMRKQIAILELSEVLRYEQVMHSAYWHPRRQECR